MNFLNDKSSELGIISNLLESISSIIFDNIKSIVEKENNLEEDKYKNWFYQINNNIEWLKDHIEDHFNKFNFKSEDGEFLKNRVQELKNLVPEFKKYSNSEKMKKEINNLTEFFNLLDKYAEKLI